MSKSYKIALTDSFDSSTFAAQPLNLERQLSFSLIAPGPHTIIARASSEIYYGGYTAFDVEHEYDVNTIGRLYDNGQTFNKYIARTHIMAYHSTEDQVMLLCGRKADVLDFCRKVEERSVLPMRTIQVDMKALQEKLPEVRGAWFRFRSGYIHAKGYMGQHIQETSEYRQAREEGDISTLSFYFEDSRDGEKHPIMVTEDGTVVLQRNYPTVGDEISFVLHVKAELFDGICKTQGPSALGLGTLVDY